MRKHLPGEGNRSFASHGFNLSSHLQHSHCQRHRHCWHHRHQQYFIPPKIEAVCSVSLVKSRHVLCSLLVLRPIRPKENSGTPRGLGFRSFFRFWSSNARLVEFRLGCPFREAAKPVFAALGIFCHRKAPSTHRASTTKAA